MPSWTETDVIDAIHARFRTCDALVERGIGDDCAVTRRGMQLITTDASIDGVHFNLQWMPFSDAAYRCLTSNLSDIAAMGARPEAFTLALGLPPSMPFEAIEAAIEALETCLLDHALPDCSLIGGDVVQSRVAMLSITMMAPKPAWPVVYRNTARPGDAIVVLGTPGRSAAGLALFEAGYAKAQKILEAQGLLPLVRAFCRPRCQVVAGSWLGQNEYATAMMDLSDGIRTDLPRLLAQSGCGAEVQVDKLGDDPLLLRCAQFLRADGAGESADAAHCMRAWMLCGGEDFGLLLTCAPKNVRPIQDFAQAQGIPCFEIGSCTEARALLWKESDHLYAHPDTSFRHF